MSDRGLAYYIPPELREKGKQVINLLSAIDPVQGIMRGMAASGRAADSDLTPEQRKAALLEAGVETASPLMMMGLGALAKQPVKATLMDVLAPTGATKDIAEDVLADPSRRNFLAGAAATVPVAALAPDVITDVVTKTAKVGGRAAINPLDMAMANIRALNRQIDEKYEILDEIQGAPDASNLNAKVADDAQSFIIRSQYEIQDEALDVMEQMSPADVRGASDDAIEEIVSIQYDPMNAEFFGGDAMQVGEITPLNSKYKLMAEEIKRRGLDKAKDRNGILKYPNARTFVEDMEMFDEKFPISLPNPSMQMVRKLPADIDEDILELKLTELRRQIAQADRVMRVDGKTTKEIDDFKAQKRREMYELQGLPPDMDDFYANGGPVISGVGSLNQTARDMFRGPRGIESLSRFSDGGEATARDKVEIESLRNAVMMTESNGDPNAVSPKGAIGLMQIMPKTARNPGFGVENAFEIADKFGYVYNDMSDATLKRLLMVPEINVELGNQYLDAMLNQYTEVDDALRAYNAGKTNVDRFIASGRNLEVLTDEAVQYPIKVTAALQGYSPKDMNEMAMFEQSPETASALMSDYPAPPEENRMFTAPPIRPQLPPSFATEVRPPQRNFQPVIPGQQTNLFEQYGGIANLATSVRPRPRPSQLN